MMKILTILSTYASVTLVFLKHPMSMGLVLMIQTINIAIITTYMSPTSWYSYILFLIMIGGMLVLFIYMTSIASNEKFKMSNKLVATFLVSLPFMVMIEIITDPSIVYITSQFEAFNKMTPISTSMTKYLNYPTIMISATMIIYLFICLVATVKITNIQHGPLRHSN